MNKSSHFVTPIAICFLIFPEHSHSLFHTRRFAALSNRLHRSLKRDSNRSRERGIQMQTNSLGNSVVALRLKLKRKFAQCHEYSPDSLGFQPPGKLNSASLSSINLLCRMGNCSTFNAVIDLQVPHSNPATNILLTPSIRRLCQGLTIPALHRTHLINCFLLKWLLCRGFVEHAISRLRRCLFSQQYSLKFGSFSHFRILVDAPF